MKVSHFNMSSPAYPLQSSISSQNLHMSAVQGNELGFGLGRLMLPIFDLFSRQRVGDKTPSFTEIKKPQIIQARLEAFISKLESALVNIRMNNKDPDAFKKIEKLVAEYSFFFKGGENEILNINQNKHFKKIEQLSLTLKHSVRSKLNALLPFLFPLEKAKVEKASLHNSNVDKKRKIKHAKRQNPPTTLSQPSSAPSPKLDDQNYNLAHLSPSQGYVITGETGIGHALSSVDDINKDNLGDYVITNPTASPNGIKSAGQVIVIFGKKNRTSLDLSNLSVHDGVVINGTNENGGLGWTVAKLKDFNGDGPLDIVIGSCNVYTDPPSQGKAYVLFGPIRYPIDLEKLDGINGFVIKGNCFTDMQGGERIDGDERPDLLLGDPYAPGGGQFYVIFGKNGTWPREFFLSQLDGTNGFTGTQTGSNQQMGWRVAAGLLNPEDKTAAIAVADYSTGALKGRVDVYYRQEGIWNKRVNLENTKGFTCYGVAEEKFGESLKIGGDFDKNGRKNLLIGSGKNKFYLLYNQPDSSSIISIANLDGTNGTVLQQMTTEQTAFGSSSAVNDDNSDLVIGDPLANNRLGRVIIIYGQPQGLPHLPVIPLVLTALNKSLGVVINGTNGSLGYAVAIIDDTDGDGLKDLAISEPSLGNGSTGKVYILLGQPGSLPKTPPPSENTILRAGIVFGAIAAAIVTGLAGAIAFLKNKKKACFGEPDVLVFKEISEEA